jgi:uncharacterized membrane protein YedE/YeeE
MIFLELLKQPWPWFIAGPLIGLMVPILLISDNKQFGISSTLRDFCSYTFRKRPAYFRYDLKEHRWRDIFVFGVLIGGFLSLVLLFNKSNVQISSKTIADLKKLGITNFKGLIPLEIFNWQSVLTLKGFIFIIVGGFFIGFGTRYADGCTSGHAIMGLSLLSLSSLYAVLGFFVGGLISTHIIFPILLK